MGTCNSKRALEPSPTTRKEQLKPEEQQKKHSRTYVQHSQKFTLDSLECHKQSKKKSAKEDVCSSSGSTMDALCEKGVQLGLISPSSKLRDDKVTQETQSSSLKGEHVRTSQLGTQLMQHSTIDGSSILPDVKHSSLKVQGFALNDSPNTNQNRKRFSIPSFEKELHRIHTSSKKMPVLRPIEEITSILRSSELFKDYSDEALQGVVELMEPKRISAHSIVYRTGDEAKECMALLNGSFVLQRSDGREEDVEIPCLVSSYALMNGVEISLHDSTLRAVEEARVWVLSNVHFMLATVKNRMEKESKILKFLSKVPILSELREEQKVALCKALKRMQFEPDHRIITQGQSGSTFYIIESGQVDIVHRTQMGGHEQASVIATYSAGEYFGEGALLQDQPRMCDVVAKGKVCCLTLSIDEFLELLGGLQQLLDVSFTARVLKNVELFKSFTDEEILSLAENFYSISAENGDRILKQGDKGDRFFIIKKGEVAFSRAEPGEEDTEIGHLFSGNYFGEGALLTDECRRASATAVGTVVLLVLRRRDFSAIAERCKEKLHRDFAKRQGLGSSEKSIDLMEFIDLESIQVLGAGTFGQVFLVRHKITGKTFALKSLSKQRVVAMRQQNHVKNEKQVLELVDHPFIVNLVQSFAGQNHVYALMEAVLGGELYSYLRQKKRLGLDDARFYLAQVFLVLEYLHGQCIVYRDLKPENLLIDASGYLKLTDFGLAKTLEDASARTYTLCGTPAYAAPEVYELTGHGFSSDWWTLGVLAHEIISGTTPFKGSPNEIVQTISQYRAAYPNVLLPESLRNVAGDMVLRLLHPSPERRLGGRRGTARNIQDHPFFEHLDWGALLCQDLEPPFFPSIENMFDTRHFLAPTLSEQDVLEVGDSSTVEPNVAWELDEPVD